jgi:hypothetical protein
MTFPTTLTAAVDGTTEIVAGHINNVEEKIGIDNSADADSLDYKVRNTASVDPGHKHSKLWASDGSPEAVSVDASGKVGIGTETPTSLLNLVATAPSITLTESVGGKRGLLTMDATDGLQLGSDTRVGVWLLNGTWYEGLTLLSTGKVGINKDIPSAALDVVGDIVASGNIGVDEVDYGATSTIVGWSTLSLVFQNIGVKKIGKTVFVKFIISGTSNAITTSFTLPYSATGIPGIFLFRAVDNTSSVTVGYGTMSGSTVTLYTTPELVGWTGSGTKSVSGQFLYETS